MDIFCGVRRELVLELLGVKSTIYLEALVSRVRPEEASSWRETGGVRTFLAPPVRTRCHARVGAARVTFASVVRLTFTPAI